MRQEGNETGVQELQEFRSCRISDKPGTLERRLLNQVALEAGDPPCGSVDASVTKRLIRIAVE